MPFPFQSFTPSFLFGETLILPCRNGLAKVAVLTGEMKLMAPYPRSFYPAAVLFRQGLIAAVLEGPRAGEILLHVVEPFSGVLWGEKKIVFPPGSRTLLSAGPERLHFLGWKVLNPGRTPPRYLLQVKDVDLTSMEVITRADDWLATPLPIGATLLDKQNTLATRDHLFLPVLNGGGVGIRALPLKGGVEEWEVDLPRAERLSRVTFSANHVVLLTIYQRQGILRVLEEATGKEVRRIRLGAQASFPKGPWGSDPYLRPPGSLLYLISGTGRGLRYFHGILPGGKTAWKTSLPGQDFWGMGGVKAPVEGPGFACLMLQVLPPRGFSTGPDLYVVDTQTGELLRRIPGLVGPGRPQILAAGKGLLFAYNQGTLGVAGPAEGGKKR